MTYTSFNGHTTVPVNSTPTYDPNTHIYQQPHYQYQHQYQQPSQPIMTSAQPYPPYTTTPTPDTKYNPATTTTTPLSPVHTHSG